MLFKNCSIDLVVFFEEVKNVNHICLLHTAIVFFLHPIKSAEKTKQQLDKTKSQTLFNFILNHFR